MDKIDATLLRLIQDVETVANLVFKSLRMLNESFIENKEDDIASIRAILVCMARLRRNLSLSAMWSESFLLDCQQQLESLESEISNVHQRLIIAQLHRIDAEMKK